MVFEDAILNTLLTVVGTGAVISGLSALSSEENKWSWKKFLYTLGISGVSGLAIIETLGGNVTADNWLNVVITITGASFIGNKLFGIGAKLKSAL